MIDGDTQDLLDFEQSLNSLQSADYLEKVSKISRRILPHVLDKSPDSATPRRVAEISTSIARYHVHTLVRLQYELNCEEE